MKKVIKGRVYNSNKAKKIAFREKEIGCKQELYLTRAGAYFVHTKEKKPPFLEKIVPLSAHEAKAWAEKNINASRYTELFSKECSEKGRVPLNITVDPYTKDKLIQMREETGKSISKIIIDLMKKESD